MDLTRRSLLRLGTLATGAAVLEACTPPRSRSTSPGAAALPAPRAVTTMPFQRLAYGTSASQFGDLRVPGGPGPHPVVMIVHGGFWTTGYDLELMTPMCEALARDGTATWNVEYRRVGDPGGGWPGTFLDVAAAADQLRTLAGPYALDQRRVATLGHSAGGQLALWAAGRRWIRDGDLFQTSPLRVQGAVSLAGVVDLRRAWSLGFEAVGRLMGGTPDEYPTRYDTGSPADLLPLGVPQVLLHGSDDQVVPATLSADYRAEAVARGDDVQLVPLQGVGHMELIQPTSAAWPAVLDAVRAVVTLT